jgi:hypothetical protein
LHHHLRADGLAFWPLCDDPGLPKVDNRRDWRQDPVRKESPVQKGRAMNTRTWTVPAPPRWSDDERHALEALRMRYFVAGDQISARELARLRFWRWLYRTGRLVP